MRSFLLLLILTLVSTSYGATLEFREGDVIGQSEIRYDPSTIIFEAATSSRFGHVGIVMKDTKGKLSVFESNPPHAQVTTVEEFMERNGGSYAVIRKSLPLTEQQLQLIKKATNEIIEKRTPYNFSMVMNDQSMNCSEFVRNVFASAGIEMGRVETINTLSIHAFNDIFLNFVNQITENTFDFKGKAVTPVAVMQSSGWQKVDGPLELSNSLTENELLAQWKKDRALEVLEPNLGISVKSLEQAAKFGTPACKAVLL